MLCIISNQACYSNQDNGNSFHGKTIVMYVYEKCMFETTWLLHILLIFVPIEEDLGFKILFLGMYISQIRTDMYSLSMDS